MTREEKTQVIAELTELLRSAPGFYLVNPGPLNAAEMGAFRRRLHEQGLQLRVVKNTLLAKAFRNVGIVHMEALEPALREMTAVVVCQQDPKVPAQVLEAFRKESKKEYPILKAAYVEEAIFIGDQHLEALTQLKSKRDLIAELMVRLTSPLNRLMGALQSAGHTLSGLIKTLSERNHIS
ncbi:MAG: 50S ribosomal protein L10 [Bacteroidia bacterium]|nr:50S ribosomal protein L10 [Bacteroidia bacterium]MDW8014920.1 50S ribosomal protein L10 [Bacteroidia bacterium]